VLLPVGARSSSYPLRSGPSTATRSLAGLGRSILLATSASSAVLTADAGVALAAATWTPTQMPARLDNTSDRTRSTRRHERSAPRGASLYPRLSREGLEGCPWV
jgi:hypothetical protein